MTLTIAAPIARVWQALIDPDVVALWSALDPVFLPPGYPAAGQHAIWADHGALLHDWIVAVEPSRKLVSRLAMGPWQVNEEYALVPRGNRSTVLRAIWSGHPKLVENGAGMRRLKNWCERAPS